jgi:hypothetical protein
LKHYPDIHPKGAKKNQIKCPNISTVTAENITGNVTDTNQKCYSFRKLASGFKVNICSATSVKTKWLSSLLSLIYVGDCRYECV